MMNATTSPEIAVRLTPRLFARLHSEAIRLDVPLEWLVASLVLDTLGEKPVRQREA